MSPFSKYIYKYIYLFIDMTFSADVGKNPSSPHMQINQTTDVHKICVIS